MLGLVTPPSSSVTTLAARHSCCALCGSPRLIVLKHPVPMGAPVDAHRGLIGTDDHANGAAGQESAATSLSKLGLARCNIASSAPSLICSA